MARPRSIQSGDETAGVRIEYVRTRRIVRLGGWHNRDRDILAIEVPASRFLDELGIAPEELGAAPTYLVLASVRDRSTEVVRHMTAAYPSELQARQVFLHLRAHHQDPDEWAQVVALDARCRMVPVCWFGKPGELSAGRIEVTAPIDVEERRAGADVPTSHVAAVRPRRWPPRRPPG
jgi:hypothetical protein